MNLIQLSVKRPVLVTMITMALTGLGLFCYMQLPRELFPEVEFPIVTVMTVYEGAGPDEIEQLIIKKLEDEISTVEGIKHLNSSSQQGLGLIMAEFYLDIDVDVAAADVRDKVNLVRRELPDAAEDPIVQKFDFNAQPIMLLAVAADRSMREIYHMTDQRIKDRISTVPGVASVKLIGGQDREIHVLVAQQRLRAYGLNISHIVSAVAAGNLETPGGQIQQNSREYNIRLRGKFTDLKAIEQLPVALPNGGSIYLRDVAQIKDAWKDIRDKVRADGRAAVGISVQKRADGNTVEVDSGVRKAVADLRKVLPEDYSVEVMDEKASWITSSIANVFSNMAIGLS